MSVSIESTPPVVVVIDDDADVREALDGLFRSVGLGVESFGSVSAYQAAAPRTAPAAWFSTSGCPEKSGLEFQEDLVRADIQRPIVFISGHADVAMSVRAMKAGAVEFLTKPVRDQDLLDAVQLAIEQDSAQRRGDQERLQLRSDYATLSPREREVMARVVLGRRNKQIATDIGLSEATVKLHRSQIMRKMGATSLVELLRMADTLSPTPKV